MIAGAMDGLLVVSLEQAVAAPLATFRMAEAGARVIKIERPEGDFARAYDRAVASESTFFTWLNRGKESLVLDFKDAADAALLHRLAARADVFVQNLAPGAAARAGFGSEALRGRNPRLITCDISGYGDRGAYRDMKAYDLLVQAESGLASLTGSEDAPGRVGISICDIAAGTTAYAAVLEALLVRSRTGMGEGLAVSLFDVMAEWLSVPLLHHQYGAGAPRRMGLSHPLIAPYGAFETQGAPVLIAVQNDREWQRLCAEVLGEPDLALHPDFVDNRARVANRSRVDAKVAACFRAIPRAELIARLNQAGIAYGSINSLEEVVHHPALRREPLPGVAGVSLVAPPVLRASGASSASGLVPGLGEHSDAIRTEFGT